jgi:hypothetical protein
LNKQNEKKEEEIKRTYQQEVASLNLKLNESANEMSLVDESRKKIDRLGLELKDAKKVVGTFAQENKRLLKKTEKKEEEIKRTYQQEVASLQVELNRPAEGVKKSARLKVREEIARPASRLLIGHAPTVRHSIVGPCFRESTANNNDDEQSDGDDEYDDESVTVIVQQTQTADSDLELDKTQAADSDLELDDDDKENTPKKNKRDEGPNKKKCDQGCNNQPLSQANILDPKIRKNYGVRPNGKFYYCIRCDHIRQVEDVMKAYMPTDGRLGDFGHFVDQTKELDMPARRMNSFKKMKRHMQRHFSKSLSPEELDANLPLMFAKIKPKKASA